MPEDGNLFGPGARPALASAVADLSWLLSRGYAEPSALKLIGNRHRLDERQRAAALQSACGDAAGPRVAPGEADPGRRVQPRADFGVGPRRRGHPRREGRLLPRPGGSPWELSPGRGDKAGAGIDGPSAEGVADRAVYLEARRPGLERRGDDSRDVSGWVAEVVPDPDPILAGPGDPVATADPGILDQRGA